MYNCVSSEVLVSYYSKTVYYPPTSPCCPPLQPSPGARAGLDRRLQEPDQLPPVLYQRVGDPAGPPVPPTALPGPLLANITGRSGRRD